MENKNKEDCITVQPDEGAVDVPHSPEPESTLFQETAERLAMLKDHTADPETASKLDQLADEMTAVAQNVYQTEEYNCTCHSRHKDISKRDEHQG